MRITIQVIAATVLALAASVAWAAGTTQHSATVAAAPVVEIKSGDPAADLVARFYHVLLRKDSPTIEEERELFTPTFDLRTLLVRRQGKLPPMSAALQKIEAIDPMKRDPEQCAKLMGYRHEVAKAVAAAGPVVMEYCRQHKGWFISAHMRSSNAIQISTGFNFIRQLDRLKDPPPKGRWRVMVLYGDQVRPDRGVLRTVQFLLENGKIDPDVISTGGTMGEIMMATVPPG